MNESTSLSIDLFKANAEINRLYSQMQVLIVENTKNKQVIESLEKKLEIYIDKYGIIND